MPYTSTNPPIYYESHGQGRAIVCCHSLAIGRKTYRAQAQYFGSKYQVITWDQRGHGKSAEKQPKRFNFYDSVEDMKHILDEAGIKQAVFVGTGQGGYLCLRFAIKYPEIVQGMFLMGAQAAVDLPEMKEYWSGLFRPSFDSGQFDLACVRKLYGILTEDYVANDEEYIQDIVEAGPANFEQTLLCLIERDDITSEIPKISAPTLMTYGDAETIPFVAVQDANDMLQNSKLEVITGPGTRGYCQPLTAPDLINGMLERFLEQIGW